MEDKAGNMAWGECLVRKKAGGNDLFMRNFGITAADILSQLTAKFPSASTRR